MATALMDVPMLQEAEENTIKVITEVYRPLLVEVLDVKDIVEGLKIQFGRDDAKFNEVLELIERGAPRRIIAERFMEALKFKEDKRGLYRAVIDALYHSENDAIAEHLEGISLFNTKKREQYRSFLWLYANRLEDIDAESLLPSLRKHLTKRDAEKIRKTVYHEGNCAGASALLLRLDRKSEDSFEAFIKALDRNGLTKLAMEMEGIKNFTLGIGADDEDDDEEMKGVHVERAPLINFDSSPMQSQHQDSKPSQGRAMPGYHGSSTYEVHVSPNVVYDEESKTLTLRHVDTIHVGNADTVHIGDIHHHVSESVQDREDCDESTSYLEMEVDAYIEPLNEPVTTREDGAGAIGADPRIQLLLQELFANCHNFEKWRENRSLCLEAASLFEHQGRASLTKVGFGSVHFFVRVKLGPDHDAFRRACRDGTLPRGLTKLLVTPELEEAAGVKLRLRLEIKEASNKNNVSATAGYGEDITVVGNVCPSSDEVVELKLRDYQEEVLTPALKGQNAMVILPTGTGKTEVAIALISRRFLAPNHVGATNHQRQKSMFVVNKVHLVKQQKDRCLKYLRGMCEVAGASGEELNNVPLDIIIDTNDVTVLTAQVLINALKDDNVTLKLSDIALLVLDECHHCQKSDPYNVLMAMYRDLKLNSPKLPRPQILGLTASPGVGDSKNMVQAECYITRLCANLDCRISRPQIYADQLNTKSILPQEINIIVKGRPLEDPYFREISVIMERIEDRIKLVEDGRALVEENDEFAKMVSRRGTQSYEQGVVNLKKKIQQTIENGDVRRELMTCFSYLREYNNSLFINRDARTSDALSYMDDFIYEEERSNPSGPADMILRKMFRDKLETLNRITNLHASINPVLNELGRQLKKAYAENGESLSIIFTKTRASAKALVKWLNEDPDLTQTNAELLIGSGMASTEQNRNLQMFKDKKCRILVATSVAEEGLDIRDCNMVFRYNYVTSDIVHLPTKGRSRAEFNGKIFVIANSNLQLQDRELKNTIRVEMMNQTVQSIADSTLGNPKAFDDRILREQKNDQKERQQKKDHARITKVDKIEKSGVVLHCIKCFKEACRLDDVRSIKSQYHVVTDDLFLDKIELIDLKKQPRIDEFRFRKRIHCGNCHCKWGTMVVFQQQELPLIAVKNFTLMDDKGKKWCPKAWKEVPFVIRSIDMDDLGKQGNFSAAEDLEGGQEKGEIREDNFLIEYSTLTQVEESPQYMKFAE